MTFFGLCSIPICRSQLHFDWLRRQERFCNLTYWSCGKYWFSESRRSSKYWHISLNPKKPRLLISPPISSRSLSSIGKLALSSVAGTSFPESMGNHYHQWVSSSLRSFLRKFLPDTQVLLTIVRLSLIQEKTWCSKTKKGASSARNSVTLELSVRTAISLEGAADVLYASSFITHTIRKVYTRGGWDMRKLIISFTVSRTFLSKTIF